MSRLPIPRLVLMLSVLAITLCSGVPAHSAPAHSSPRSGLWGDAQQTNSGTVHISVDGRIRFQTMAGFGVSERVFDDPHLFNNFNAVTQRADTRVPPAAQDEILTKLFGDLGLTRIRPTTEGGVESIPGGPFNFQWKRNDAHIDLVKAAMQRGVKIYFLSPLKLEDWMSTHGTQAVTDYVTWAMTILRRWRERGLAMPYYSVLNEPGHPHLQVSGEFIRDVIKLMGPQLRAEGFKTRFVITDDIDPVAAAQRCAIILADPDARRFVGALASHLYGASDGRSAPSMRPMKLLSEQYKLPLWMTEFSRGETKTSALDWAVLMHDLIVNQNVSAVDYLWGYFGQWQAEYALLSIHHTGPLYTGYTLDPAYYTMGQFSKFVRPGMVRIKAHSGDRRVKVAAFRSARGPVVVMINTAPTAETVQVALAGFPGNARFVPVQTTETGRESWSYLPVRRARGSTLTVTLPAQSVTTLDPHG